MIQNLCNLVNESNFDTFYKATIIETSQLPEFDDLTPDQDILSILNSLPDSFNAMVIPFLPEKFNLSSNSAPNNDNASFQHALSFPLVPQDAAIKNLLERYNNKLVVAFISKISQSILYGTQAQPLYFKYDELHAASRTGLKGYTLSMQGKTYAAPIYFEGRQEEFPVTNRGLAFQLAGSL